MECSYRRANRHQRYQSPVSLSATVLLLPIRWGRLRILLGGPCRGVAPPKTIEPLLQNLLVSSAHANLPVKGFPILFAH